MLDKKKLDCINLMVQGGKTQKQIAKEIKTSEQSICAWKKDEEFMEEYDRQLKASVRSYASEAFKTMTGLMKSENEYMQFQAAKDILDRAGLKPGENIKIQGNGSVVILDDCEQ